MSADSIATHGDPNGKVFGIIGNVNNTDDGSIYIKSGSQSDTLNVGWKKIIIPTPTPTPSITPSITPTRTPVATRVISGGGGGASPTPTPTVTRTQYPVYTRTSTPTPTPTPTYTPTITPSPSNTPADATPLPTSTASPTVTPSPSNSPTKTLYTLSLSTVGNGTVWPYGTGSIQIPYGTLVSIDADPDPNNDYFSFAESGIVGAVASSTTYVDGVYGNCTFTMPQNDCSLTASFALQNKLLEMIASGSGTVSPSTGTYPYDETVPILAIPAVYSKFNNWVFSGPSNPYDGSTTTAASSIHMIDNRTATAYFTYLKVVYANVNSSGNWVVSYKNTLGNNVVQSGSTGPQFYNTQITVGCGSEVYSGGGLFDIGCTG